MAALLLAAVLAAMCALVLAVAFVMLLGSSHEGGQGSLRPEPPTRAAAAARRITGLYVRRPTTGARQRRPRPGHHRGDQVLAGRARSR